MRDRRVRFLQRAQGGVRRLLATRARREAGHDLAGPATARLAGAQTFPTAGALGGALPEHGAGALAAIRELAAAHPAALRSSGPRFFHWVVGGGTPAALAADWLTSAYDQNAFAWESSPLGTRLEEIAIDWLKDLFALPPSWGGVLTTGATMANLTGLAAGRGWGG